jgi:hypothetical protein
MEEEIELCSHCKHHHSGGLTSLKEHLHVITSRETGRESWPSSPPPPLNFCIS